MPPVAKPRRQLRAHFFKEWRKHRGLTQERAAERLNVDRTTLGRVENRVIPYSQELLEAAAEAYQCEPWDILNVNPLKEGEVVDFTRLLRAATPEERAEIIGFARGRVRNSH
jgi:transcriptional regulator with XRE-family HTH domain